jgi:hypothetical protein
MQPGTAPGQRCPSRNLLETANLPDDLALNLIRNNAEDIGYERVGERNRLLYQRGFRSALRSS